MSSSTTLKISLTEVKSITKDFAEENIVGKGLLEKIYEGQLSLSGKSIDVAVRRLDHSFWLQDIAFDKEVTMLSSLKHDNLVSLVGVCEENGEMIIINERETHGSLEHEEHSTVVRRGPSSNNLKLKLKNLEHMKIQFEDIKLATNKFSADNCIASGGFGTVYKAELEHVDREYCFAIEGKNGRKLPKGRSKVAVKHIFDTEDGSGEQGFYAEIDMLTSCKHSNILTLLGFCDKSSAMMLIYEYASNGSLEDYLRNKSNMENDSWAQRIKICLQVARGLSYLHTSEGDRQEIVHRDIKSANILLDENLNARIGTPVYMDPQYAKEGKLKKEVDIYSLGVVLIEILCGRLAYDPTYRSDHNQGLTLTARQHFDKGTVKKLVDGRLELTRKSVTRPNQESLHIFETGISMFGTKTRRSSNNQSCYQAT
ncbi:protein kinase, ATP binding site-containing protein [Tanacetum coccineum]